ncbi:hypothetical protein HK098_005857 [Nowakowskiella sp. JEL0407]|nr:hypothetical protein HK098_005857 [Nowakowskiella sp. JEL0407]
MYRHNILPPPNREVDEVYLYKLKSTLLEMNELKEAAIREENYSLADQSRLKMTALKIQVVKMEHQLNADIISNCTSQWQNELSLEMSALLRNPGKGIKLSMQEGFPLNLQCHKTMVEIVSNLPNVYYDSFLRSMIIMIPQDLPETPSSPFGWEAFLKKIPGVQKPGETLDVIKSAMMLGVVDLIMLITEKLEPKLIRRETVELLLNHSYYYVRMAAIRKFSGDLEPKLFEQILRRLSIIVGDIAIHDRADILANIFAVLDPLKKATSEEIVMVLSVSRYFSARPKTEKEASQLTHLIRELNLCFERTKRSVLRMAIIQALERLIQPLDYTAQTPIENFHVPLINEVVELHKRARKWTATEELRGAALRLIVIILVNSKMEYFGTHIDNYLNMDLCAKTKVKSYVYDCLLQLLRGRFYLDTRNHAREQTKGTFKISEAYRFITRPFEDEVQDVIVLRLKQIADLLVVRRKGPIGDQNLDICADIFVQMAVHNLQITIKLIAHLLDPRNNTGSTETLYVGLRALRTIVDPDSGFALALGASTNQTIQPFLSKIAMDFSTNITQIMHLCDHNVGIPVVGRITHVSEPTLFSDIEGLNPNLKKFSAGYYARPEEDIFAMLLDSTDLIEGEFNNSPSITRQASVSSIHPPSASASIDEPPVSVIDTLRRLSISAPRPPPNFQSDLKVTKELNDLTAKAIKGWYEACGVSMKDVEKLAETSLLFDPNSPNRPRVLKPEQTLMIRLFKEVICMVPHMPISSLIGGEWFIGAYLLHSSEDLVQEVAHSLQKVFIKYPELRLSIINGFLNFIKTTPFQDDIALCTILSHLSLLISTWVHREGLERTLADVELDKDDKIKDFVYRVSCKLDGCMLVMLGRPNTRIRKICLQTLADFHTILEAVIPNRDPERNLSLHSIITKYGSRISKYSMYAFMERDLHGYALVPKVTAGLTLLSVRDVALSDFTPLFRYYLGETARVFMQYGRQKALKHAAKFIHSVAIPYMTSVANVDGDFVATYSSYLVLMMSMAGAPMVSDIDVPAKPISETERLLFMHFRAFLTPILCSENSWEIKAVVSAAYFAHRSIVQLLLANLLQWYDDLLIKSAQNAAGRTLDNVIYLIRCVCQNPEWDVLVSEPQIFSPNTIIHVCIQFLRFAEMSLKGDTNILSQGPVYRIKTVINYCIIVERLSEALLSLMQRIHARKYAGKSPTNKQFQETSESLWSSDSRQEVIINLKNWYVVVQDLGGAVAPPTTAPQADRQKIIYYRHRLISKIGQAAEKVLSLGDVFENGSSKGSNGASLVPQDILVWMGKLQSNGYSVFTPALLYNYENILGSVLAQSYTGRSEYPMVFTDAVFDQILPRTWLGPQLFLSGEDGGVTSSEDYIASIHALPTEINTNILEKNMGLISPVIDQDTAEKLRVNLGSLLFFGLYNMMNSNKMIRNRSFLFVRELFRLFSPKKNDECERLFKNITGSFYTSVGYKLKEKILAVSDLASVIFADEASSFIWEAVRCSRSVLSDNSQTLLPSQQWILHLIHPWCKYVSFQNPGNDMVYAEFYRYLMDAAFFQTKYFEEVHSCWREVASSTEYGSVNTELLTETLVQICGKFDKLRDESLTLLSQTFAEHPTQVAAGICYHLGSGAFPWKPYYEEDPKVADPHHHAPTQLVKDYIRALHSAIYETGTAQLAFDNVNEYATSCKSSVMLLSELLLQNYHEIQPHLPVLLNYVILHLPKRLQENSVSTYLLSNMVEGFISTLHSKNLLTDPEYDKVQEDLRRLLVLLDTTVCFVDWESDTKVQVDSNERYLRIPISEFLELLLSIFSTNYELLSHDLALETLSWAAEGYLGPDHTIRAIEAFTLLVNRQPPLPREMLNALSSRLYDHVSILSSLESEASSISTSIANSNAMHLPPTEQNGTMSPNTQALSVNMILGWDALGEGKRALKANTENVLVAILRLHKALINLHSEAGEVLAHPKLFWGSLCMLNIPAAVFPRLYTLAVENCKIFLEHQANTAGITDMDMEDAYDQLYEKVQSEFNGIQPLLLQSLFPKLSTSQPAPTVSNNLLTDLASGTMTAMKNKIALKNDKLFLQLQYKAFDLLLTSWIMLPEFIVDSSPNRMLSLMYTILYSLTAIFGNPNTKMATNVAGLLHQVLSGHKSRLEFDELLSCLKSISTADDSVNFDDFFEKSVENVICVFVHDYGANIAEYFGFAIKLGPQYSRVILKMTRIVWTLHVHKIINLEPTAQIQVPMTPSISSPANSMAILSPRMTTFSSGTLVGGLNGTMQAPVAGNPFKSFMKKLPFFNENVDDVTNLVLFLLHESRDRDGTLKEIDVTASGRIDLFHDLLLPIGSARRAQTCLLALGVQPSTRMYNF